MSTSTSGMNSDLQRLALEQDALLVEARRRLDMRDRIDGKRRIAQRQAQRHRIEERVLLESKHSETAMTKLDRPPVVSFTQGGSIPYGLTIDPSMLGTITVTK